LVILVDANQEKSKSVNTLIDQGSVKLQSKASVEESQEKPKPVSVDTLIDDVSVQMKSKASVEESQNKSKSLFGSAISEGTLINHAFTYYVFFSQCSSGKAKACFYSTKAVVFRWR
jgi:hypothetical protein